MKESVQMFWDAISGSDRAAIAEAGTTRHYASGAVLFFDNEAPTHVVVVLDGEVKLTKVSFEGREVILELRKSGELIGELGPIDGEPRSATATAIRDTTIISVPSNRFLQLLNDRGSIAVGVLGVIAEKLRQASDRRVAADTTSSLSRLCDRLVELSGAIEPNADGTIDFRSPLTQQELAEWIGVSRDAIVLALRDLRDLGLIETGRRTIRVLDLEGLKGIAKTPR